MLFDFRNSLDARSDDRTAIAAAAKTFLIYWVITFDLGCVFLKLSFQKSINLPHGLLT